MIRTIILSTVAIMLPLTNLAASESEVLRVAVEGAYPPFSEKAPSGEIIGFDVDIAFALCEELQRECVIVEQNWDGMIPGLLARKYDAIIASMTITKERQKKIDFSEKYYSTPGKFVSLSNAFQNDLPTSLAGKIIGVQSSTAHADYLKSKYKQSTIREYGSQEEVYLDLTAGRLDAILADALALNSGFLSTENGKKYSFFGKEHTDARFFDEGLGIGVRKNDELKDQFTAAIKSIRANGIYQKINAKYFDVDIYGE